MRLLWYYRTDKAGEESYQDCKFTRRSLLHSLNISFLSLSLSSISLDVSLVHGWWLVLLFWWLLLDILSWSDSVLIEISKKS